jgi:hypothetical protein
MNFVPTATLGIMAREYEQQQFIGLLQTLGPQTPVLPLILKGILGNSSLSNKNQLIAELDKMSAPNPMQEQQQQMQLQMQMASAQAQLQVLQTKAQQQAAAAQKDQVSAMLMPEEQRVKAITAASTNLDSGDSFERRLKLADTMLKEKQINLKAADIASNERIAAMQMQNKSLKM